MNSETVTAAANLFLLALPLLSCCNGLSDVNLKETWAEYGWYNPSIVVGEQKMYAATRITTILKVRLNEAELKGRKAWWVSKSYICEGKDLVSSSGDGVKCNIFDPWQEVTRGIKFDECEWPHHMLKGHVTWDESGISDAKLWHWPGRGVYAIYGRKPQRKEGERFCGPLRYHQWLSQISNEGSKSDGFNLMGKPPLALLPPANLDRVQVLQMHKNGVIKEKNWGPFNYIDPQTGKESLYMAYSIQPHIVIEILPSGATLQRYQSTSDVLQKYPFAKMHGGPSLVFIPSMGARTPYYLGILHFYERDRKTDYKIYRHFAYRMSPMPPFQISALSEELPLTFNTTYRPWKTRIAFVSGLDVQLSSTEDQTRVLISYGSADIQSRVLSLSLSELDTLFPPSEKG